MSYDDDNVHLVFKYNTEYEDDLEIHKSTTIQSLYTKKGGGSRGMAGKDQGAIEMQDMGVAGILGG